MVLHPLVLRRDLGDLIDQALLDTLMVLAGHGGHAALQESRSREGARIVAGREAADHAGQRVERIGVERMLDRRDAAVLQLLDRLDDLVAEIDPADALVTLLDSRRLAFDGDLEPDP